MIDSEKFALWHRRAALCWLVFLVAAISFLLGDVQALKLRVDSDLLALLPQKEKNPQEEAALRALSLEGERQWVLLVSAPTEDAARKATALTRKTLEALSFFPQDAAEHSPIDFYAPYRSGLLTDADRQWLARAAPEEPVTRALTLAYAPFSSSPLSWENDPFGFFGNWLQGLGESSPLRLSGGELMTEFMGKSVVALFYSLPGSAFDANIQSGVTEALAEARDVVRQAFPDARLLSAGVVLHAAAASRQAQKEMRLIGLGGLAGTLLLIGLIFQSARALQLIVLSLATGSVVALAASFFLLDRLHLLTLVFGVSLIGVAVDYAILVFAQHLGRRESLWPRFRRILPTLLAALTTPMLAYLCLAITPFPGLKQMAVFAAFGILGAWASVLLFYPYLLPEQLQVPKSAGYATRLLEYWPRWRGSRAQWILALLLLLPVLVGLTRLSVEDDIRSLFSGAARLMEEQRQVSEILRLSSPAQMFIVSAPDTETLLQREENLTARLRQLIAEGKMSGFEAASRWLPSQARQREARALQSKLTESRRRLAQTLGLAPDAPLDSDDTHSVPLLTPKDWLGAPHSQPLRFLWLASAEENHMPPSSLVLLRGLTSPNTTGLLQAIADAREGVRFVDKTSEVSSLMQRYRYLLTKILALVCFLVPLALALFFRRQVWRVIMPVFLSGLFTLALMGYLALPVQMLSLLALFLTLGMGVDYAVFLQAQQKEAHTLLATTLAALLTLLSFGLLALSGTPALATLGLTATLGISFSWMLTPCFCRQADPVALRDS
ncbi:MAG: MMPL family transporter [Zoogloeaceae bacterium]|nr:MMPL family transporter [Zoogloeaceae bacterium]